MPRNFLLLFAFTIIFSGCGEKSLPLEIKPDYAQKTVSQSNKSGQVSSFSTNNLPQGNTPAQINLNLEESGVIITAEIMSNPEIKIENLFAGIVSQNIKNRNAVEVAASTNSVDNKIIFPAIKIGLKDLRITLEGKNISKCFSEPFDTCDNTNKTIPVKLFEGVTLRGKVTREDGSAVTNFYFRATPRGQYEKKYNPGHVGEKIKTDESGNYEVSGLLKECYKFYLEIPNAKSINTNVWLIEKENFIDFIFKNLQTKTVNGIVIYEETKEPASDIKVKFRWKSTFTDENGKFSFNVKENYQGGLILNEPGYAKVNRNVRWDYNGERITLFLYNTATIKGTITTEKDTPVSELFVAVSPSLEAYHSRSSVRSLNKRNSSWEDCGYNYKSETASDEFGDYVISNVAAPETYSIKIDNIDYFLDETINKTVKQGETAICNFKVFQKPIVMVKLIDKNNQVIRKYDFKATIEEKAHNMSRTHSNSLTVNLKGTNEWYRVHLRGVKNYNSKLSLLAVAETGDEAYKENIPCDKPGKSYVVLKLGELPKSVITGFIYDPDEHPLIDSFVSGSIGHSRSTTRTDHLGYFEMAIPAEKGKTVELNTIFNGANCETNVTLVDDNIEWILPQQRKIVGEVYINDFPATNFSISVRVGNTHMSRKSFMNKNGKFSIPLDNYFVGNDGEVHAYIAGFAKKSVELCFGDSKICDVGKIIVSDLPATINGRIIDHENLPIKVWLGLQKISSGKTESVLNLNSDKKTGKFSFTDLPKGTYFVRAYSQVGSIESESIELIAGDTITIPDLVILTTNIPLVNLTFIFSDGMPAANVCINELNEITDQNGCIEKRIKPGEYKTWTVTYNNIIYYAEPFTVTERSKNIQINLLAAPKITGKVYVDGQPLNNEYISFFGENIYSTTARNGFFEINAKPGKYAASCKNKKVVAEIELSETGENIINFKSENNIFEFSFKGNWYVNVELKTGRSSVRYVSSNVSGNNFKEITGLPSGKYNIWARGSINGEQTNIYMHSTLKNNEREKIVF